MLVREDPEPFTEEESPNNKYGQRKKIGTPTLGRTPNYVTTVGLGKLEVLHAESQKLLTIFPNMATLTYDPTPADQPEFRSLNSKH